MSQEISLRGVFPPIPTPFDGQGDVAFGALADNLAWWNEYDLRGYIVLGSNGEGVMVAEEEKIAVWAAARKSIPSSRLMVAGTGCQSTRETITLTRRAADAGADAALVWTPHYFKAKMTADSLVRHYEELADASPIPILIYNVPGFTGVTMSPAAVARAARHPNVVGMKDTTGNIAQLAETVRLAGPDFQVLAGSASYFLPGLSVGAAGGILALANIAPDRCLELFRLFQEGRWQEAAELQRWMLPINHAVTTGFGIAGLKAAMDMMGHYGGPVRLPLLDIKEEERQTLKKVLTQGGILS
ncbi:MAG: dihydrodipicolinate synthase family protein [Anaerolineae bacterium]|jgi:4-hydroxy-2-oxoglutarate aldolase|nr:dihydrodipicolinate synthase family protein [Anaerolineae bacterium]MDX9830869.1 dihydrodipicolinate synthase family protein [Anaerolineae bacterium]